MPPRRTYREPPVVPHLFKSRSEIEQAITKLNRRIADVGGLDPSSVRFDDRQVETVEHRIRNAVLEIYGESSPQYQEHRYHQIWRGGHNMGDSPGQRQAEFASGLSQTKAMLEGLIEELEEKMAEFGAPPEPTGAARSGEPVAASRRVFVVHGHDHGLKNDVALMLTRLSSNQSFSTKGRTLRSCRTSRA